MTFFERFKMKALLTIVLVVVLTTINSWSLTVDQQQLNKLYAQETPKLRDVTLVENIVAEIMPQIKTVLPDSTKQLIIRQSLNGWRGTYYIPVIFFNADRNILRSVSLLRDMLSIINQVRTLWPKEGNEWSEIEIEIYFDQLYLNDGVLLNKAFPQPWYSCGLKETIASSDGDANYDYKPCVSIRIDTTKEEK